MISAHRLRRLLASPFARRPFALQRWRWPNPLRAPYTQKEITLYRPGELGDVVMCLAVVRAIRERNPETRITFITKYDALLRGHPLIDRVMSEAEAAHAQLRDVISLRYEVFIPLRLHMIDYFAGCVGLRGITHEIPLPDFTAELENVEELIPFPRPWVMICRQAGPHTPNKDWPADRWEDLVVRLGRSATVVDLGTTRASSPPNEKRVDLRGRTTLRQYCALLSLADLVITPGSSAVHIAAAYHVPTLTVLSGYESPENTTYPLNTILHRRVPCSPCWLQSPCPFNLECLRQINVDDVYRAAMERLRLTDTIP